MSIASNDFQNIQNNTSSRINEALGKVSWTSIIGGFFVAILSYWFLVSIGLGIGAFGLKADIGGYTFKTLPLLAIIWMVASNSIALLFGGFAYMKLARSTNRYSRQSIFIPALIVSSVYFAVMSMQTAAIILPAFKEVSSSLTSGSKVLLEQPAVQNFLQDSVAGLKTDGMDLATLASGIGSRLMSGDANSVKTFIANNSSLSREEVDVRANKIQSEFKIATQKFSDASGTAIAIMAWTLMITLLLGSLASWSGALLAARKDGSYLSS